jgi:hypothetical protein
MLGLLWGITWRMVLYGLTFGALFGTLVMLCVLFSYPAILFGALLGGGIGALLGLVDAFAMIIIMRYRTSRFTDWKSYRSPLISAALSANVACGLGAFILTSINMSITGRLLELINVFVLYTMLTSIVSGASWFAVARVLSWIEQTREGESTI